MLIHNTCFMGVHYPTRSLSFSHSQFQWIVGDGKYLRAKCPNITTIHDGGNFAKKIKGLNPLSRGKD